MKNIYLLLLSIFMISLSCETPENSPQVIGFTATQDGEKSDVVAGPDNINEVWESYIDAHNSRDIEGIRNLNAVDFSAYGPAGEVVEGSEAHIAFLTDWFENNNPRWTIQWAISNSGENVEGDMSDFVTAGHEVTLNVDGEDITVYQVIDAMISDGKIVNFNVYQQERGEASSE
jgi:ketosteroid isomerase-like protein